jgi:DNA-binding response OmpR family regulator
MKKLLIIEDELPLLKIMMTELKAEMQVIGATNGKEGLAIALREKPDLILLDILIPKMNGLELLSKLREDSWGRTAPVVILTNTERRPEHAHAAFENGVFEYLSKSRWTLSTLKEMVREKLYGEIRVV